MPTPKIQPRPPASFHGFDGLNGVDQLMLECGTSEGAKAFWSRPENGEAFLRRWVAECPGTRPVWWWKLFAPAAPFQILGHIADPYGCTERRESEAAYLARLGLLTPPERALFDAGELEVEEVVPPAYLAHNGTAAASGPTTEEVSHVRV